MKKKILMLALMATMFCGSLSASNWVTVTTAKGNVFHFDTDCFGGNIIRMLAYVWNTSEGLDEKYPEGNYRG